MAAKVFNGPTTWSGGRIGRRDGWEVPTSKMKRRFVNCAASNGLEFKVLNLTLRVLTMPFGLAVDQGGFQGGPHP